MMNFLMMLILLVVIVMIEVKVTGVDKTIRSFDRKQKSIENALTEGTEEAGEYLIECIQDKFGHYQPGWARLKIDTIKRKLRRGAGANADKPLIEFGDMMFSFYTKLSARTRKHMVHILSDDPKLPYHMYGVPSKNLPKRDPVRPTVKEENDKCLEIIKDAVRRIF